MKLSHKIIILTVISVSASLTLILTSQSRKDEVEVKSNITSLSINNCLAKVRSANHSNSLEVSNLFDNYLVSTKTLRNRLNDVRKCSELFNFQGKNGREAWYILENMPDYQPVPEPIKRALKSDLLEFSSLLENLSLTPREIMDKYGQPCFGSLVM